MSVEDKDGIGNNKKVRACDVVSTESETGAKEGGRKMEREIKPAKEKSKVNSE